MEPTEIKSRADASAYMSSVDVTRMGPLLGIYSQAIELSRYGRTNPNKPPVIELETIGIVSTHPEDSGCISWSSIQSEPQLLKQREQLFAQVFRRLLNPPRLP